MTRLVSPLLRPCLGTLMFCNSKPEQYRAMFLTAREIASDGLLALLEGADEPLMAKGVLEGDSSPWWQTAEADTVLALLTQVLDAVSPEGYYFGGRKDEPAELGWWPK